jgi:hypothetical protein
MRASPESGRKWRVGDALMRNHIFVLHRRNPLVPRTRWVVHRTRIEGDQRIV